MAQGGEYEAVAALKAIGIILKAIWEWRCGMCRAKLFLPVRERIKGGLGQ